MEYYSQRYIGSDRAKENMENLTTTHDLLTTVEEALLQVCIFIKLMRPYISSTMFLFKRILRDG